MMEEMDDAASWLLVLITWTALKTDEEKYLREDNIPSLSGIKIWSSDHPPSDSKWIEGKRTNRD